jgi:hypothetical protein
MLDPRIKTEIARRNGALSKGPRICAGNAKSAQTTLNQGQCSDVIPVLQNEDPAVWQRVLDTLRVRYRPADDIEIELVEDVAFCLWRLRRVRGVEAALWDITMEDQAQELAAKYSTPNELTRKAYAFRGEAGIHSICRYESLLRGAYDRALNNLARYRNRRSLASAAPEHATATGSGLTENEK